MVEHAKKDNSKRCLGRKGVICAMDFPFRGQMGEREDKKLRMNNE
jgi:hypothetical protein